MTTWDGIQLVPTLGNDNSGWDATVQGGASRDVGLYRMGPFKSGFNVKGLYVTEVVLMGAFS
eukprot:6107885-Amphidinium_carterae.1